MTNLRIRLSVGLITTASLVLAAHREVAAQESAYSSLGHVVRSDPRIDRLIPKDAKIKILAEGFTWAEGPVWMPDEEGGHLLFSDIPRNTVFQWTEGEGISVFLNPSGYTGATFYGLEPGSNGLLRDPQGRLVLCQHGDRRVAVLTKNGGMRTLADNYRGQRLNSPNDGCFKSNGALYFTDPPYGLPQRMDDPRKELDFQGVYRLTRPIRAPEPGNPPYQWEKRRHLQLLTKEMTRPNGIAFSPDEKTLYVAQSDPEAALWKAFPVQEDGTLGKSRVFYDATEYVGKLPGLPDGMKVDQHGNVFATGPGGVWIFSPEGDVLGRLHTGERTANCGWGNDGTVLYICADMYICRIQTSTKGAGWD